MLLNTIIDKYETQISWDGITLGRTQRIKNNQWKNYCVTFCTWNMCKGKFRYKSSKFFGESKGKDSLSKHEYVCMA